MNDNSVKSPGKGDRPSGKCKLRIGTVNVGTMSGRASEVVEMLTRRKVDVCCLQETRWRGGSARKIQGKDSVYKFFWCGNQSGHGGVGVLIAEKWIDNVLSVVRHNHRCIQIRFLVGTVIVNTICCYAPQTGLPTEEKDEFYDQVMSVIASVPDDETLVLAGDMNGHVGENSLGFEGVHGGNGFGNRNPDGLRLLDFCVANQLAITNTFFNKSIPRLITFSSGGNETQIDYLLVRRSQLKWVKNVNVISSEECISQHKLLVGDIILSSTPRAPVRLPPRVKTWKLREEPIRAAFEESFKQKCGTVPEGVDDAWSHLRETLCDAAKEVCGSTKGGCVRHKETWWWNDEVNNVICEKRKAWKLWKSGGPKEDYLRAKRLAKSAVYIAKRDAQTEQFGDINNNSDKNRIFQLAKKLKRENADIVGEKCVRNDEGLLALTIDEKLKAWQAHYDKLLNEEFPWNPDTLSDDPPVQGPAIYITPDMVENAMSKMKCGKSSGPSGIIIEMMRAAGDSFLKELTTLLNRIVYEGTVPSDWNLSFIINLFKGKGDALSRGNYHGLKLQEQAMKVMEHILNAIIRDNVSIDEMQFGFMPGRSTTDAIFILRQLQEKFLGKKKNLYLCFVDLEKAFDRVPRSVLWWAMRKLGVDEWIIRTVQAMYRNAQSKVRVGSSYSEPIEVSVGVHQGSVLSPLLFIIVMEALSQEFRTGCPWELLYADDLVIVADSLEELKARLKLWKNGLEQKGLKVNVGKTKIMLSAHDAPKAKIKSIKFPCAVCGKGVGANSIQCTSCNKWVHKRCTDIKGKLTSVDNFICKTCLAPAPPESLPEKISVDGDEFDIVSEFGYLGDALGQAGGCADAVTARIRSAWKAFHELLPLITNRGIYLAKRGNLFVTCARSVLLYGSETWPLSKDDLYRIKRCDHAMLRWICGVKITQPHSTESLRRRLQVPCIEDVLRENRLRLFGHRYRQDESLWTKKIMNLQIDGPTPRGRPKLRWSDVVNADMKKLRLKPSMASNRKLWRDTIKPVVQPWGCSDPLEVEE